MPRGRPATFGGVRRREDANGGPNAAPTAPFSMEAARTQLAAQLASNALCSGHSDALVSFSPGQDRVEVLWKGFLMPQDPTNPWELSSQTQALNFLNSGLHALSNDRLASNFVRELGKTDGQGVFLMQDLLDLEYSTDAGRQREVVSFQRGLVAFVTMLTMRRMQMASLHMDEANYVYTYMRTAHVQLFRMYLEQLDDIVDRHSVEDRRLSAADFLEDCQGRKFAPLCFTQLCLPFIRLLYLLGNKFQDLVYEDSFKGAVNKVGAMINEWVKDQEVADYDDEDADAPLDSKLCFKFMKEEIVRLHKMVNRGDRNMEAAAALKKKAQQMARWDPDQPAPEPWDVVEVGIPEEVVLSDGTVGPRHDNDHREIRDIQLLPTTEECLTPEPPLLPGNFPFHVNAHWLPPGPERWVDTHFRLFREDLCGTIRTCLQDLAQRLVETRRGLTGGRLRDSDVDYNVYPVVKAEMTLRHTDSRHERDRERRVQRHGLCLDVSFPHPTAAQMSGKKTAKATKKDKVSTRRGLWEKTGWLPYNGMVALVKYADGALQVVFCHIVERDPDRLVQDVSEVTLQPFEMSDFATLERWQSFASLQQEQQQNRPCMLLLEFNKVFLVAYEPVLRALQSIQPAEMPFLEYLAPEAPHEGEATMEAPLYCYKDEFRFDLGAALRAGDGVAAGRLLLNPLDERNRAGCEAALVRHSTLERDQAKALVRALSSRVACIQGLPGSGKSFIGTILTQIIVEAKVAPVLIVCYTNHALDQFLCNLLDIGITSLVRVGGQCKEPRLEKYNLSKLPKTSQRYELKLLYEELDRDADLIEQVSRDLNAESRRPTWKSLKWFLETNFPDHFDDFEERSADIFADGWEVAGCDDILEFWLQGQDGAPARRRNPMRGRSNVWQWSVEERHAAVVEWDGDMRASRVEKLVAAQEAYRETLNKLDTVRSQADVTLLQRVQIIGMTTTGVAKNQQKIAAVAPRVVICEEAGEVLEAQLMACLSPSCQQLVLIGDHKQLRPHIAEYGLSVESSVGQRFALDVSLFERLVAPTSGLPWWVLTEQHRMRPQISQLLRMQFYPELRDAKETNEYPPLLGVDKNVYFVTHDHPEDNAAGAPGATARSHSNAYEVAYLVATLRYLLQQGYHTSDIAILTPYVSQLIKLRSALRGQFVLELNELDQAEIERFDADEVEEDDDDDGKTTHGSPGQLAATKTELSGVIRVATVDNFQGEEATVILVSLVRSSKNPQRSGTIGFLKTPNRVNVLLSRAKHGMLLVGHGELLRANVCGEECPSREFCHECGDEDIKERVADVLLFQTYGELDPSEDPVLVMPCCSMVYTMATLDGTLHLSEYYTSNGKVRGALPGEFIDIPQCPNCKQPIRGLRRYGRVTKRAAIDAAEKKFITHSQRQLAVLQERVNMAPDQEDPAQIKALRHDLRTFGATVKRPPCQKAYEACVALLTKAKGGRGGGDVAIDDSTLPVPNTTFPYPGYFSLLSAQLSLIGASASLGRAEQYARQAMEHFERNSFSQQKCEAQLILVQILLMSAEKKLEDSVKTEEEREKRQAAVAVFTDKAVDLFNALITTSPPSFRSKHEQDLLAFQEKLLSVISRAQSATFYQEVSKEEMRLIKTAMQTEFRGSGHWYRCVNGHSYSIGECGMAMEETRCPECGARVGGANHSFVEGTVLDEEMDSLE
ncbi:hypothetical protein BBJ28_00013206 [Nothophytophthora sp. Chile5]|nr:hypothetical protein BBJ28_00013206 [Nothophytophthora sp. Chile5]